MSKIEKGFNNELVIYFHFEQFGLTTPCPFSLYSKTYIGSVGCKLCIYWKEIDRNINAVICLHPVGKTKNILELLKAKLR